MSENQIFLTGTVIARLRIRSGRYAKKQSRGFAIVPYLSFDFGGHVNNEIVTNSKKRVSVLVPLHSIFRSYLGTVATLEWTMVYPMTLTFDESLVHIAQRETIGLTTDQGVELRRLRGLHPRSKVSWNVVFDPAGHYSFVVTYENGRLAPNFEYLNKLNAGIKVTY